jgi:hypothetical protein
MTLNNNITAAIDPNTRININGKDIDWMSVVQWSTRDMTGQIIFEPIHDGERWAMCPDWESIGLSAERLEQNGLPSSPVKAFEKWISLRDDLECWNWEDGEMYRSKLTCLDTGWNNSKDIGYDKLSFIDMPISDNDGDEMIGWHTHPYAVMCCRALAQFTAEVLENKAVKKMRLSKTC